jgi:hypothetical protein
VFNAVAVTVTVFPEQRVVAVEFIETLGVLLLFTVITMLFDVALLLAKQVPPVTVISQVTVFPLAMEAEL